MSAFGRIAKQKQLTAKLGKTSRQSGIALVSALVFLVITVIFVGTSLIVSASNKRLSTDSVRSVQAQFVAEAGIERFLYDIWYTDPTKKNKNDLTQFRQRLDDLGIKAGPSDDSNFKFGEAKHYQSNVKPENSDDVKDEFKNASYDLEVRRIDIGSSRTTLRVDVTAYIGDKDNPLAERRITEDINIQLPELPGFALLTNNANCIFCHTSITSLEVVYDKEGNYHPLAAMASSAQQREAYIKDKYRIKVGALQHLLTDRHDDIESIVAGTVYSRGTTDVIQNGSTLSSVPLQEDTPWLSDKAFSVFESVDCSISCNEKNKAFYLNYPLNNPPDGDLPASFPLPAIDKDQDRIISHAEWAQAIADARNPGKLIGGEKSLNPTSQSLTDQTGLTSNNPGQFENKNGGTQLLSGGSRGIAGNLILKGTQTSPLAIEGSVYVDGDVVISGYVTGNGRLIARGNVYVVGDIRYACDGESQDFNYDSSTKKACNYGLPLTLPQFALVAGKNIMIGPYMMPNLATPGSPAQQLTQTDLSEVSQDEFYTWYLDPGFWPSIEANPDTKLIGPNRDTGIFDRGYGLSFSSIEMAIFNQFEYLQAQAGKTPRYYSMREGGPVFRCTATNPLACRYYGTPEANPSLVEIPLEERLGAVVSTLSPTDAWLTPLATAQDSELNVRERWINNVENANRTGSEALQIDGILYSSNAAFALAPSKSSTKGQVKLHGALVAADTGILVPGIQNAANRTGLSILYDERLSSFLDITNDKDIIQIRSNYRVLQQKDSDTQNLYPDVPVN